MTLTVGNRRIADCGIQSVSLRPVVGAYELVFTLRFLVLTGERGLPNAAVVGARVVVLPSVGEPHPLGFARPEQPIQLVCGEFEGSASPTLRLNLLPNQIAALEALRETGDLTFELTFAGTGVDRHGDQHLLCECSVSVPRSEWLQTLRNAKARNAILLEVPVPFDDQMSDQWYDVCTNIRSAEEEYRNGNYRGCVATCRVAIDGVGKVQELKWSQSLSRLSNNHKEKMTKFQRVEAVFAALRHYSHMAHHTTADGGETYYSRAEAEFTLTATVAAVRLVQIG